MPNLSLEDALKLVYFYAERDSPKYEPAAIRWLERYLTAGSPSLRELADAASELAALLRYGGLCGFRWPARPRIRPLRRGGDAGCRSVRAGEWRQDERGYWLLGPFLPAEREERLGR
jgi:hypothetical protein